MTANGMLQLAFYVVVLLALARPLGAYMARVYQHQPFGLDRGLGWLERLMYRWSGVRPAEEMGWKTYAAAMLLFNLARPARRLSAAATAGDAAPESERPGRRLARLVLQHRRQLCHQHRLAGLWR